MRVHALVFANTLLKGIACCPVIKQKDRRERDVEKSYLPAGRGSIQLYSHTQMLVSDDRHSPFDGSSAIGLPQPGCQVSWAVCHTGTHRLLLMHGA